MRLRKASRLSKISNVLVDLPVMENNNLSRNKTEYSRVPKGPPVASSGGRSQWGMGLSQCLTQSRGSEYWSTIRATNP